jgi:hypothetical protein
LLLREIASFNISNRFSNFCFGRRDRLRQLAGKLVRVPFRPNYTSDHGAIELRRRSSDDLDANASSGVHYSAKSQEDFMSRARKAYARYFLVRGFQTMWQDDPAKAGSLFRQFLITSNEFNSTEGRFQVYGLEGASAGIKNGKFTASDDEPRLLYDNDFDGLDAASKEFRKLIADAERQGFRQMTELDILEFEDRLRRSGHGA